MFPHNDPTIQLELHRQHVADLIREAADHQRARASTAGRRRRFGRWRRQEPRGRTAQVTASA